MSFVQDLYINGNLTVNGTTSTINSETLNVADKFIYLNNGYIGAATESGIIINRVATEQIGPVNAANGSEFHNSDVIDWMNLFNPGDILQISGMNNKLNNGLFEYNNGDDTTITIKTSNTFAQTTVYPESGSNGKVSLVNITMLKLGTDGKWYSVSGSNTGAFVTKQILLSGDSLSNNSITLLDETNQLRLGTTGVATINAAVTADATFTIPTGTGSGDFVFNNSTSTLTNKTLSAAVIKDTVATTLGIQIQSTSTGISANKILTLDVLDANKTLKLGGNVDIGSTLTTVGAFSTAAAFAVTGSNAITLATTNAGTITLPAAPSTLASLTGSETFTNKTLTSPSISGATLTGTTIINILDNVVSVVATYSSGGAITLSALGKRINVFTGTSSFTVTLPTGVSGTTYTLINATTSSASVTINTFSGSQFIDNGSTTSIVMPLQYQRVTLTYVGSTWYMV